MDTPFARRAPPSNFFPKLGGARGPFVGFGELEGGEYVPRREGDCGGVRWRWGGGGVRWRYGLRQRLCGRLPQRLGNPMPVSSSARFP